MSNYSFSCSSSCYKDFGCLSKGLNFLRQKIIQHAVQTSDWPPPEVIFGSKSTKSYDSNSDESLKPSMTEHRKSSATRQSPSSLKRSMKRKKLKFKSSRTGGLTCVGSADMSTIVAGFVEFERSFNRMTLSKVQSTNFNSTQNIISDRAKFERKPKKVSIHDDKDDISLVSINTLVDPQLLGHAIELCLKERKKISEK